MFSTLVSCHNHGNIRINKITGHNYDELQHIHVNSHIKGSK